MANLNWAYGLAQGVKGVADAGAKAAEDQIKLNNQMALNKQIGDIQLDVHERQAKADELRRIAAEDRRIATAAKLGKDINEGATGMLNTSDAGAINSQFGSNMTAADAQVLTNNPAARKAYGLPEDTESMQIGRKAEMAGMLGGTKEQKELYDRQKDIETTAYQRSQTKNAEKRNDILEAEIKARAERADALEVLRENRAIAQTNAADRSASIAAATTGLKDARAGVEKLQSEVTRLDVLAAGLTISPEAKEALDAQIKALRASIKSGETEAGRWRAAVAKYGNVEIDSATPGPGAARPAPAAGTVIGGMEFKGGDPNDKKNWMPKAAATATAAPAPVTPPAASARDLYLKAAKELEALKGGLLMPTPSRNKDAIARKEAEVKALLQATYQ